MKPHRYRYSIIVSMDGYVKNLFNYISKNFFEVSYFGGSSQALNEFLNIIDYPKDRNVNFDMITYYIRDNRELVEFKLL